MEVYETEEQQVEALYAWFKKRGKLLITTAACGVLLMLGAQYWWHHLSVRQDMASQAYQDLIVAIEKEDQISAKNKAKNLSAEYTSSVYGTIAQLYLAKAAVQEQKLEEAKSYLQGVMNSGRHPEFQNIARLRLAKILFEEKKAQEALAVLNNNATLLQELKGDILISQNKLKEAQALYQLAQEAMLKKEINHPLLKMKIESLGEA